MSSSRRHIFWDWNGTLLDDTQAALDTLNDMLRRRGRQPMTMDFYRANFRFPVKPFYESIGMFDSRDDWDAVAREYHEVYERQAKRLHPEAMEFLERIRAAGVEQSITSALRQDLLERITAELGVARFMAHICGTDNLNGASKVETMRKFAATLPADTEITVIGDSLHDREAAEAIGARCILHAQGTHTLERLRSAGARAVATVPEAVEIALRG